MPEVRRSNWAATGIFLILALHTLRWASDFLIPVTAAVLGFLIVLPLSRRGQRVGIPSGAIAFVVCVALGLAIASLFLAVGGPFADLLEDLPHMIEGFRRDMSQMGGGTVEKIQEAAEAAESVLGDTESLTVRVANEGGVISRVIATAPWLGGQIVLTLVLMFFLIASGTNFIHKLVQIIPRFEDKRRAVQIVDELTGRLGHYLSGITLINAGLGLCIGIAMWLLDVPHPLMFGLIAFSFNFVPYLGAVAGAGLAALVTYSGSQDLWNAGLVLAVYMALTSIEGQFVTPYLISGRLSLNPTVVFLTVAFFAWLWSVIGMVVAVPILVVAKLILEEFEETKPIGVFLG